MFPLKAVSAAALAGNRLRYFQEGARSVRQAGGLAIDQSQLAVQAQFADRDANQFAVGQFVFHADLRDECDSVAHDHEALDGLQGGEFDVHVQRRFVALESLDHFFAIGRRNVMGDERLGSQLPDADLMRRGQGMAWGNHENQLVQVDHRGTELGLLRDRR